MSCHVHITDTERSLVLLGAVRTPPHVVMERVETDVPGPGISTRVATLLVDDSLGVTTPVDPLGDWSRPVQNFPIRPDHTAISLATQLVTELGSPHSDDPDGHGAAALPPATELLGELVVHLQPGVDRGVAVGPGVESTKTRIIWE